MILKESILRNSTLSMRHASKLDYHHPIVDSKKSNKPLFFCLYGDFHPFIHLLQEDFH